MKQGPEFNFARGQGEKKELRDRLKNDDFFVNTFVKGEGGGLRPATVDEIEQQKSSQREPARQRIAHISKLFEGFIKNHGGLTGAKKALIKSREDLLRQEESEQPWWFTTVPVADLIPGIKLDNLQSKKKPDPGASDFRLPSHYPSHEDESRFWYDQSPENIKEIESRRHCDADTPFATRTYHRKDVMERIRESFRGQTVVDIAAGSEPYDYLIADYAEAKAYIGVEPFRTFNLLLNINSVVKYADADTSPEDDKWLKYDLNGTQLAIVQEDMLSFLKRLPDNSVSLWCSGVDENIISDRTYWEEVAKEIKRVLDPKGAYVGGELHIPIRGNDIVKESLTTDSSEGIPQIIYKKKL